MMRRVLALAALLLLSACGGGGGGSAATSAPPVMTPPPPPPPAPTANVAALVVDAGPAGLDTGPNGFIQDNVAFVSVTLCAPGSTTNCQIIDHVQVDTGSVGLRILQSAISPSLLAALPTQSDPSGNPVGECFTFVDGFVFGSVRSADFQVAGENVAGMPLQVVGDTGAFTNVPSSCSSGGGMNLNSLQMLGANGIIGIGVTLNDCGAFCTTPGGQGAASYYDCPTTGCFTIIARAATTTAPFQQLPNPVAAMAVDNNGTILSLPAVSATGQASVTGSLIFGIGTQSNNALGAATVLTTTTSASNAGPGMISAVYKGQTLNASFLDSGTSLYLFADTTITQCTGTGFTGFYCPASPLSLSALLQGQNGATASAPFVIGNAKSLFATSFSVLPEIGASPTLFPDSFPNSFDFGLPFFYGRNVYTALEGRNAGGVLGPYFAF